VLQPLGSDTLSNLELAKELTDNEAALFKDITLTKQNFESIITRPTKWPPGHSTEKSSLISPRGNIELNYISIITVPNLSAKKTRFVELKEFLKAKPYTSIKHEPET
jgi:hypothetical protein